MDYTNDAGHLSAHVLALNAYSEQQMDNTGYILKMYTFFLFGYA